MGGYEGKDGPTTRLLAADVDVDGTETDGPAERAAIISGGKAGA